MSFESRYPTSKLSNFTGHLLSTSDALREIGCESFKAGREGLARRIVGHC